MAPQQALSALPCLLRGQLPPISFHSAHTWLPADTANSQQCISPNALLLVSAPFPQLYSQFKQDFQNHQDFQSIQHVPDVPARCTPQLEIYTRPYSWFSFASSCKRYWTGPRNATQMSARELEDVFKRGQTHIYRVLRGPLPLRSSTQCRQGAQPVPWFLQNNA